MRSKAFIELFQNRQRLRRVYFKRYLVGCVRSQSRALNSSKLPEVTVNGQPHGCCGQYVSMNKPLGVIFVKVFISRDLSFFLLRKLDMYAHSLQSNFEPPA